MLAVTRAQASQARGETLDEVAEQARQQETLARYEVQSQASYGSARLWDDGVIDPLETRERLAMGIAVSCKTPFNTTMYGLFRM